MLGERAGKRVTNLSSVFSVLPSKLEVVDLALPHVVA